MHFQAKISLMKESIDTINSSYLYENGDGKRGSEIAKQIMWRRKKCVSEFAFEIQ